MISSPGSDPVSPSSSSSSLYTISFHDTVTTILVIFVGATPADDFHTTTPTAIDDNDVVDCDIMSMIMHPLSHSLLDSEINFCRIT